MAYLRMISLVLSVIEHIDPVRFEHYRGNEIALVHEVLTIIGANTTEAYRYSRSPAGAMGLFQFIPKTYRDSSNGTGAQDSRETLFQAPLTMSMLPKRLSSFSTPTS